MNRRLLPGVLVLLVSITLLVGCAPRTQQVLLTVDGQRRLVRTSAATVGEALREAGILLAPLDQVEPPSYTPIEPNLAIVVRRVRERVAVEERPVPYERDIRRDATLPQGELRVQQLGRNGVERQTVVVRFEDGVETSRRLSTTEVLTPARPEILILGTRGGAGVPISGTLVYLAGGNAWLIRQQSHLKQALTRTGDLDGHVFSLSPDSRWLLFSRRPLGGEAGRAGPLNTLWLIRVDVTNDQPRYLGIDGVLWAEWHPGKDASPGRLYFAYTTAERVPTPPGWKANNDLLLASLEPDGRPAGRQVLLPRDRTGLYAWWGRFWAWAPDGLRLAWGDASTLGTVDASAGLSTSLDGKRARLFSFEPYETDGPWVWTPRPAWRPDGAGFVAVVHGPALPGAPPGRSERFDLYFIPVRSGATERLAEDVGMWASPAWSAQGWLAFGQAEDPITSATSRYRIVVADAEPGSSPRVIFPADDRPGVDVPWLAWSPDGRQLVTVWQGDLYLLDATGNDPPRPLTVEGGALHPQWR